MIRGIPGVNIFYRYYVVASSIFGKAVPRLIAGNSAVTRIIDRLSDSTCNSFLRSGFEISYSASQIKQERIPLQPHGRTVSIAFPFPFLSSENTQNFFFVFARYLTFVPTAELSYADYYDTWASPFLDTPYIRNLPIITSST